MVRVKDYQRSKVYRWERGIISKLRDIDPTLVDPSMDDKEIIDLVQEKTYSALPLAPSVVFTPSMTKPATYSSFGHVITIPRWARHSMIVLHEVSHAIVDFKCNELIVTGNIKNNELFHNNYKGAHGDIFIGVFIKLISDHFGFKADNLVKSARIDGSLGVVDLEQLRGII